MNFEVDSFGDFLNGEGTSYFQGAAIGFRNRRTIFLTQLH